MTSGIRLMIHLIIVLTVVIAIYIHTRVVKPPVLTTIVSFDTSGRAADRGFRPHLAESISVVGEFVNGLDPARDYLSCYRTDTVSLPWFSDLAPESGEAFEQLAAAELAPVPVQDGTHLYQFFGAVAPTVQAAGCYLVLALGDGDDDTSDRALADRVTLRAATAMAVNPRCVVVLGASPQNWPRLSRLFLRFGNRVHFCMPASITADDLARWADQARHLPGKEH